MLLSLGSIILKKYKELHDGYSRIVTVVSLLSTLKIPTLQIIVNHHGKQNNNSLLPTSFTLSMNPKATPSKSFFSVLPKTTL